MNSSEHDRDRMAELLSQALHEEAAMVNTDPGALQSIQERTRPRRSAARQRWAFGALGAAAATAAVITAVVIIGDSNDPSSAPGPANSPTKGTISEQAPVELSVPVTYVGWPAADRTARLYTEEHSVSSTEPKPVAAVHEFLTGRPEDPEYTSGWPAQDKVDVVRISSNGSLTQVDLEGALTAHFSPDGALGTDGGQLAVQAFFRTAGLRPGDLGTVIYNKDPVSTMFGVDLPVTVTGDDDVRALITIDNIVDGQAVSSPVTVKVSGNTFEGTVNWQLLNQSHAKVDEGVVTTSMGSWTQADIDLGQLDPATYTIRCLEYSPENGKPGNVDDKRFTVQ